MYRWAASRSIFTVCTLTRAAVFIAHQSVHTLAQSRQETLSYNSIQFWSGDNPVKASDCSDGQVRVVQQTEEGHSRSCAAVGVAEERTVVWDNSLTQTIRLIR